MMMILVGEYLLKPTKIRTVYRNRIQAISYDSAIKNTAVVIKPGTR